MTQTTNYKSDFDFLMKLTDCRELARLKPSEYDWECVLYTTDPTKTYPFSLCDRLCKAVQARQGAHHAKRLCI